jgi:hypothetical protein
MEPVNGKTRLTHGEAKEFIRRHFEEFVNKKNAEIGNVNFAADFVDHGLTFRRECLQDLQGRLRT